MAYQKANPGKMSFASSGNGSSDHLTAELFWLQTGTTGLHIPYKGGAPAISDLLGGQVEASFQNINAVVQHISAGKLRALAITSAKRSEMLPDVPTLTEAGVKGVDVYSWQAVVGPKGLPADVRDKMHAGIVAALNDPAVKQQFTSVGFEIVANTPAQFAAFQQQEFARWKQVIETARSPPIDRAPRCIDAASHRLARDPGRGPRQHAAEPERRARPVLHAQPADPDRQRRPHRRRRSAGRREDPPDAGGRARAGGRPAVRGAPAACCSRCSGSSPIATPAAAGCRPSICARPFMR